MNTDEYENYQIKALYIKKYIACLFVANIVISGNYKIMKAPSSSFFEMICSSQY